MHAKYQVAIFNIEKVMANVKVGANRPTDQQTDQQTNRQTGQKQYVPQYILVDIKMAVQETDSLLRLC